MEVWRYTRAMRTHAAQRCFLFVAILATMILTVAVSACSQQGPTPPAAPSASAQAAANAAAAAKELKLYRQMLAEHSDALAAPIGAEIVQKYPASPAAAEVRKTLPQVQATAKAKAEHERLANLWWYQVADVDGTQSTASIYSTEPAGADRVRLVLRRHAKWGNSVFLFAPQGSKGFVCKDLCKVVMRFDGKRETWQAYLPKTGEPAMFIKDDARFIRALAKAQVIEMNVVSREHGKETLKFEVGGYDAARFAPLPGH